MRSSLVLNLLVTIVSVIRIEAFVQSSNRIVTSLSCEKFSELKMISFSGYGWNASSQIRDKLRFNHDMASFKGKLWNSRIMKTAVSVKIPAKNVSTSLFPEKSITNTVKSYLLPILLLAVGLAFNPLKALAMGATGAVKGPVVPMKREEIIASISLFLVLFMGLSMLHAAEIAITTLYPWKVKEFAEDEEKRGNKKGVFKTLNQDITRVLTTILVTSTASSIYGKKSAVHII